jgi:hypothetical protein
MELKDNNNSYNNLPLTEVREGLKISFRGSGIIPFSAKTGSRVHITSPRGEEYENSRHSSREQS